jgi:hypothetical protein
MSTRRISFRLEKLMRAYLTVAAVLLAAPLALAAPTKLTNAQFTEATQMVFDAYGKKPFDAVYKEVVHKLGEPAKKAPPMFSWYGTDEAGKCVQFYVQKNNGEKWAGTGSLEADAKNCK